MKRSPMPRRRPPGSPPRRAAPKTPTAYRARERDTDLMRWVKTLECCAPLMASRASVPIDFGPCEGVIEADHAGTRGMSQKAPDDTCIPLCVRHHRLPGLAALVPSWIPRGELRVLKNLMISRTRGLYIKAALDAKAGDEG